MKTSLMLAGLAVLAPFASSQLAGAGTLAVAPQPDATVLFDVDGDGDADLATTADGPDRVDVYTNDGSGAFTFAQSVFTGSNSSPHTPVAADLDGDGDLDLAVTLQNANQVRVLVNTGGVLANGGSTGTGADPRGIIAFDADGDGDVDLATANRDGFSASVLINGGAATFTSSTLAIGGDVRGVAAGDVNGDGTLDLIVSNQDARRLELFANNGAGSFSAAGSLSLGFQLRPEDVDAGDLDGDGDVDLATAASGNGLNVVSIFTQTAPGTFAGPANFASGGADPSNLALLDADADGDLDVLVANTDSNNAGLLINAGNATFGAATALGVGAEPGHVAIGDIDGNGSDDAVVTNEAGNSLSLFTNVNAGGAFVDLGGGLAGVAGVPLLEGEGTLAAGSPTTIALSSAAPSAVAGLVQGLSTVFVPFKGGVLVPSPDAILVLVTSGAGDVVLGGPFPAGLPSGTQLTLQYIVQDAAAPLGFALSNAIQGTTP